MRLALLASLTLASTACAQAPRSMAPAVVPGVEALAASTPPVLRGKRVGLITNQSGIDRTRRSTIDVMASSRDYRLVALFSPEHGIRGTAREGDKVGDQRDAATGLPVYSLYGETNKPTPAMLDSVDALVFDIQDVGVRQYTYESTLAKGMQAAKEKGIPFVVLDRPNPVGGDIIEGGILDTAYRSFVGIYPMPSRHGLTIGELARYFNGVFGIGADLTVVPMSGWRRDMWGDETGLPFVAPSPNLPRIEAIISYPGTVYLEGTNLTEGRGTDFPFEQTGAPWLDAAAVVARMRAIAPPGVRFEAVTIDVRPDARKYPGMRIPGLRYVVTDRAKYRPIEATLLLIDAIRTMHPDKFAWGGSIDRLAGTGELRARVERGELPALLLQWQKDDEAFRAARAPYLLY